jgi:truncated hemoglobin YjbI
MPSLYEHAGGEEALHRLEELFYSKVLADPVLKRLFPTRQPHHVDHLTWFTAESFGGPDRFTRELGFEYLIDVHRGLEITEEERQRFAELYMEALDEAGLPDRWAVPRGRALPHRVRGTGRAAELTCRQRSRPPSDPRGSALDVAGRR